MYCLLPKHYLLKNKLYKIFFMKIEPTYTSVGSLFNYKPMFFIPKYQRAYAWDNEPVEDFLKDLKTCFDKRKSKDPISHFFGGIISVKYAVSGAVNQHEYEIIDGQQRIVTFTLLVACLIKEYRELLGKVESLGDVNNKSILEGRIKKLSERYIEFTQEIQRKTTCVQVLKLSRMDHPFYKELIRGRQPTPTRYSHYKMQSSYKALLKAVKANINDSILENKIDNLEIIENIIETDFAIMSMVTENKDDAYRLFQVINDRGTNLTVGDLLKSKTLEILEGFCDYQDSVEELWDDILSDPPTDTKNYLNWIYESYKGDRAKQSDLFDVLVNDFFPQHREINSTSENAKKVCEKVKSISEDIIKCRKLKDGQWLYPEQQPITGWDRSRLSLLLSELDHTLSMPLLLAASKLDHKIFSEITQIIEKVFFRYKIICNQHIEPLKKIYYEESLAIRANPSFYKVSTLKQKLQDLIKLKAPDEVFKNGLQVLEYKSSGSSNKPLKYFLMNIEYYYQWYKSGAVGTPVCVDKSRVYDFAGTSIEHIYPQNADENNLDTNLEPLKNALGNLTILDPAQNTIGGNDSFDLKRVLYQASSVVLTKEIGKKTDWTRTEIDDNKKLLTDIALKVFYP